MKLSERIKRALRISVIFMSLAGVFVVPGVMKCSGSVDVPKDQSSAHI